MQGVRVNAAGEDFTTGGNDSVVGTSETRDRVKKNDDVAFVLDQTLGFFDHHFGDLHVTGGGFVKSRRNDFAFDRTLHVSDFFRALVDEQNHQHDFGMIGRDRVRNILQQHGFTSARRRNDQSTLAFAEWRQEIHDTRTDVLAHGLELDALLRIKRRQVIKENLIARFLRRLEVNGFDLHQREVFLAFVRRTNLAADGVAGFQVELANL